MGINMTFVCTDHRKYHTPIRGNEGAAFQALVREHYECFTNGNIRIYHDGYFINDGTYTDFFPSIHQLPPGEDQKYYEERVNLYSEAFG